MDDGPRLRQLEMASAARWKNTCADVVRVYAQVYRQNPDGKPLGPTNLRNAIMRDHDATDPSGFDSRLKDHHISDWLKPGGSIGDIPFSFIESFIWKMQFSDPKFAEVKLSLYKRSDALRRTSMARLYLSNGGVSGLDGETIDRLIGRTFFSPSFQDRRQQVCRSTADKRFKFSQIALHVNDYNHSMFSVNVIYSVQPFWNVLKSKLLAKTWFTFTAT